MAQAHVSGMSFPLDIQLCWVMQHWQPQEKHPQLVKKKLPLRTKLFKLTEVLFYKHTEGFVGMAVMMGERSFFSRCFHSY